MPAARARRRTWAWVAVWLATVLGIGLLLFLYHHLAVVASGGRRSAIRPLINEMTASLGAGLLFWPVWAMVRRWPVFGAPDIGGWPRRLGYLFVLLGFSAIHTTSNWGLRTLLYPIAGQGAYDYGAMPLRYLMELPVDVLVFGAMVIATHVWERRERARAREVATLRLEQNLTEARLTNLHLQLQPHFLFNALNTISATMHRDVDEADELIERLGDLLRASLRTDLGEEVTMGEEVAWLEAYFDLLRARFGDRLTLDLEMADDPDLPKARVPPMILQPLVENAVRHGAVSGAATRVVVSVRRQGNDLVLEVLDDGPGAGRPVPLDGAGLGLRSVAERLALLHGDRHRFSAGDRAQGGFRVDARLPFRTDARTS